MVNIVEQEAHVECEPSERSERCDPVRLSGLGRCGAQGREEKMSCGAALLIEGSSRPSAYARGLRRSEPVLLARERALQAPKSLGVSVIVGVTVIAGVTAVG